VPAGRPAETSTQPGTAEQAERTQAMRPPLHGRAAGTIGVAAAACIVLLLFVIVDRTPSPPSTPYPLGPHPVAVVPAETFGSAGNLGSSETFGGAKPPSSEPVVAACGGGLAAQGVVRDHERGPKVRGNKRPALSPALSDERTSSSCAPRPH
jgi:hypothetical protein